MNRFQHYSDGEYEYRIERGSEESGEIISGELFRVWKLSDRPTISIRIRFENFCTHEPQCVDEDETNRWNFASKAYLPLSCDWEEAEIKLLGRELIEKCKNTIPIVRAPSPTVSINLGRR